MLRTLDDFTQLFEKKKHFDETGSKSQFINNDQEMISILTFLLTDEELEIIDNVISLETKDLYLKRQKQFNIIHSVYFNKLMKYFTDGTSNEMHLTLIIIFLLPFLVTNNSLNIFYRALILDHQDYLSKILFKDFSLQEANAPKADEKMSIKDFEIISRYDFRYKRIENYNDFEINHCMAYEFAKRKHPILDMNELEYINDSVLSIFEQSVQLDIDTFINSKTHIYNDFLENFNFDDINKYNHEIFNVIFEYIDSEIDKTHQLLTSNLETKIKNLVSDMNKKKIYTKFFKRFFKIAKLSTNLKLKNIKTDYEIHQSDIDLGANNTTDYIKDTYNFIGVNTKTHSYSIVPYFSTPTLYEAKKWEVNLQINLALSDDELYKYIKHIKQQLMSKNTTKTQHYDSDIKKLKFTKSKDIYIAYPEDSQDFKLQLRKFANMLFIYDCHLLGFTQREIISRFNKYNDIKLGTINKNKYNQYIKYAKTFIDDKKYKGLVDGTFTEELIITEI